MLPGTAEEGRGTSDGSRVVQDLHGLFSVQAFSAFIAFFGAAAFVALMAFIALALTDLADCQSE